MLNLIKTIKLDNDTHYLYECSDCNTRIMSKNKAVRLCTVCSNARYNVKDIYADEREYTELLSSNNRRSELAGTNIKSNDLWDVICGIYTEQPTDWGGYVKRLSRVVLKCKKCGIIKIVSEYNGLDKLVCNKCRNYLARETYETTMSNWSLVERQYENKVKKQQLREELNKQIEETEKETKVDKNNSTMYSIQKRMKALGSSLKIISRYEVNGVTMAQMQCENCGALIETYAKGLKSIKDIQCNGCKILKEKDPNYLGIMKRDIRGTVKNGLVVEDTLGDKVKLRCHLCGKPLKGAYNRIDFLNGKIFHNECTRSDAMAECPLCNGLTLKPYAKVIGMHSFKCDCCGEELPSYLFKNDIIATDKKIETKLTLNIHSKSVNDEVELVGDISKCKDILYVNSKGENYYNCRCTQHHQNLILSQGEIDGYTHEKCNKKYDLFVEAKDLENLSFIRKKEINNE